MDQIEVTTGEAISHENIGVQMLGSTCQCCGFETKRKTQSNTTSDLSYLE